jgi:hypothetical protein
MKRILASSFLAVTLAMVSAGPAQADTTKETPGGPCTDGPGVGTGNPCKYNHGNPSPEGNSQHERTDYDHHPDPFTISRPGNDRGAFITQIGDAGRASIRQSANTQYARIDQDGANNDADITQADDGAHYAALAQTGDGNVVDLSQSGIGVQVALLQQAGDGNAMQFGQHGGIVSSGVLATQTGDRNTMALLQSGDNNQAWLTQNGSGNAMTATQTGGNNQLAWTQNGDNHSDLAIDQTGGQSVAVTQSW